MTSYSPGSTGCAALPTCFPVLIELPGGGLIRSRTDSTPAPLCMTLVNLADLEEWISDPAVFRDISALLSPDESSIFASFAYHKRKREWLGGRLAAKSAVLSLLGIISGPVTLPAISILPAADGSPRITAHIPLSGDLPALSISHSDRYGVALAATAPACGIDIQKISAATERVADRFCDEKEVRLLDENTPQLSQPERLTLLWSAKEAVKKAMLHDQPAIFRGVELVALEPGETCSLLLRYPGDQGHPALVRSNRLEDCFLSTVIKGAVHA